MKEGVKPAMPTSGMVSLNMYWKGRKVELVMARLNRGGFVVPLFAMICCNTDPAPADSPQIVTSLGSPPNNEICKEVFGIDLDVSLQRRTHMLLDPL